jgi:hypothetical protein
MCYDIKSTIISKEGEGAQGMRFQKYLLSEDPIVNKVENGETTGFTLKLFYPNYRGMYLAYIIDIMVVVDGVQYHGEDIRVTFKSGTFTLNEMQTCGFSRWNYAEPGEVFVRLPGGLKPGKHYVEAGINSRGYLGTHEEYIGGCREFVIE